MKGKLAAWGCLAALGLLLARSAEAAQAVRDGLALCAGSVIPALFPFLAVSGLLTALDAGASPALGPLARLLGCSRAGARAFLLGLTGSYPVGARTVAQLYRRGGISRREACRLLLFSNNCGPAFILGVAGLGCFGSLRAGVLLWGVHILAALVIALALPRQAAGLLGWGGLSVHGQSAAVLSGTDLPMGPYLAAKAAHAAVSVLLAWPVSMCL